MRCYRALFYIVLFFICDTSHACNPQRTTELLQNYIRTSRSGDSYYLLSFPRSGNTLVRYMFEFITGCPTVEMRSRHDTVLNLPLADSFSELEVDVYKKPLWKVHRNRVLTAQHFYDKNRTVVVFLLRNYRESVLRCSEYRRIPIFDSQGCIIEEGLKRAFSIWDVDDTRPLYFKNIEFYESIPEDKKILIYYEELVSRPFEVIDRLRAFFNCSSERADELKKNYTQYMRRIHSFYNIHESVRSKNNDLRYYSKKYTYAQCVQIDDWVKKHHMDLWERYLSHYDEKLYRTGD